MIEQALLSETSGPVVRPEPPAPPPPPPGRTPPRAVTAPLDRKLDQIALAGVTPPRGIPRVAAARLEPVSSPPPLVNAPSDALLSEMAAKTKKIERPAVLAMDALILDAIAAAEATKVMPPQSLPQRASSESPQQPPPKLVGLPELTPSSNQKKPRPISLTDAKPVMPGAASRRPDLPRPPPLPQKRPTQSLAPLPPPPVPTLLPTLENAVPRSLVPPPLSEFTLPSLPPQAPLTSPLEAVPTAPIPRTPLRSPLSSSAPVPKLMTVLDEVTIPGMSMPSSSGSSSGKTRSSDFYKLQLEFEDTPARPLPALASLVPMPVAPPIPVDAGYDLADDLVDDIDDGILDNPLGARPTDPGLHAGLDDLDGIQDLDALAQALGLKSVADLSIPSAEGAPVLDDDDDDDAPMPPPMTTANVSAVRRAAVMAALGEDEGYELPVERPKLAAAGAAIPVIVRIPSRPKVTAEARERARNLYLAAIEALGKGDRIAAVGHLKLAIHYDEQAQLYRDLVKQIERSTKSGEAETDHISTADGPPALLVMKPSGRMTPPKAEWRTARTDRNNNNVRR